jgi:hypothetical protein
MVISILLKMALQHSSLDRSLVEAVDLHEEMTSTHLGASARTVLLMAPLESDCTDDTRERRECNCELRSANSALSSRMPEFGRKGDVDRSRKDANCNDAPNSRTLLS